MPSTRYAIQRLLSVAILALGPITPAVALQTAGNEPIPTGSSGDPVAVLVSTDSALADRLAAGLSLLAEASSADRVKVVLGSDIGREPMLRAIASRTSACDWLSPLLMPLMDTTPDAQRPALYAAAGTVVDRQLAHLLLRDAQSTRSNARDAFIALCTMVGFDPTVVDLTDLAEWMEGSRTGTESQWYMEVATRNASLARSRTADVADAISELITSYRTSYDLLKDAPDRRPELLIRLIDHDREELREFGYTLAERELQAARQLGVAFNQRVAAQLIHPSSETRVRAARLLPRLGFDDGGTALGEALSLETDPVVAGAMLEAVSQRWRVSQMAPHVVRWIAFDSPARAPAFDAARTLIEASAMTEQSYIDAVRSALASVRSSPPTLTTVALATVIGGDEDIASLSAYLSRLVSDQAESADARRRLVALAPIVAARPEFASTLADAAQVIPDLAPSASRSISLGQPPSAAASLIVALPFVTPRARQTALSPLVQQLSDTELVSLALRLDTETKIIFLRMALGRDSLKNAPPSDEFVISVRSVMADALILQHEPQAALEVIQDVVLSEQSVHRDDLLSIRTRAQLALGNIEEVIRMDVPPHLWLAGLRDAFWIRQSDVALIVAQIRERFRPFDLKPSEWDEVNFYEAMSVQSQANLQAEPVKIPIGETPTPPPDLE